jgi:hypothetical protein
LEADKLGGKAIPRNCSPSPPSHRYDGWELVDLTLKIPFEVVLKPRVTIVKTRMYAKVLISGKLRKKYGLPRWNGDD